MKRFSLCLLIMVLLGMPVAGWCQDGGQPASDNAGQQVDPPGDAAGQGYVSGEDGDGEAEEGEEEVPPLSYLMEPDIETWLGGRFVHLNGSTRAMEYGWPHSSLAGGLRLRYSPLPFRFEADLDWLDSSDFSADFSGAYKDIVKFDYTGVGLWHNLDHYVPQPETILNDESPDDLYHVTTNDHRLSLRLKWPDRAYHLFADFRQFEKEGTIQERFFELTPVFTEEKSSLSRDIDWITRQYVIGLNGHFGIVELEYSHLTKTFEPHKDVSTQVTEGASIVPRSVVPVFQTNSDTVKAHTDLTGRIVASATFTTGDKQNHNSGAEVDFDRGYADLTLIPLTHMTVAVRYRYKDTQESVPFTFGSSIFGVPGTPFDPMDNRTNTASVTVRYAPINQFSAKAEYTFENVQRTNAGVWSSVIESEAGSTPSAVPVLPFQAIPNEQNIHTVKAGVSARPFRGLDLRGTVEYVYTEEPAYPIDPKNSVKGSIDADWALWRDVNASAYYRFTRQQNGSIHMHAENDNAGTIVTWMPIDRLAVYANYDYSRYNNRRDIQLLAGTSPNEEFFPRDRVPYTDSSHLYALGANYGFPFPLTLGAEFHQSWSRGLFRTDASTVISGLLVTTDGLGDATDLRIRETGGNLTARYDFPRNWGASCTYTINDYKDLAKKPQDGDQDGTAQTVLVMLSKKW